MQARRIARELALLSLSQLPSKAAKLDKKALQDVVLAAVRTLTTEARDTLETAAAELQRSDAKILDSETRAVDLDKAKTMLKEAIALTQNSINRLGGALDLPEFVQLANQTEVREYALEIVRRYYQEREEVQQQLDQALVDWQLSRLAAIDRHILQIATVEIAYLGVPDRVAINEAVELAKRYSEADGHRFINGVLRRVAQQMGVATTPPGAAVNTEV
ncbi:transcription antitermination protein NusB [filamentous cyanobacterium LEGE 11480]|uniref:Transcription antitermination protein NusB n=1 Tax=Romeriopsis navalis LEGE 11480 TaxID=2777977 RepID=A0A928VSR3_9CYAN|nr:transcription antitermination factor NusB [Romeriopsis navalis]MBE9032321.1 transcription antitermination protein NusB [Romeriopsis navalis LEGE 11480]